MDTGDSASPSHASRYCKEGWRLPSGPLHGTGEAESARWRSGTSCPKTLRSKWVGVRKDSDGQRHLEEWASVVRDSAVHGKATVWANW